MGDSKHQAGQVDRPGEGWSAASRDALEPRSSTLDLTAVNAVSEVVENRPRPLREFDQIYMKTGDMVAQAEHVARWAAGRRLAFIGDGDGISISVALLQHRGLVPGGPTKTIVYDFDERICNAVTRLADKQRLDATISASLYNVLDPFPGPVDFDCFYTNPPWGASNGGESVKVFMERGMEATGYAGEGMLVIADDDELSWPKQVLANVQRAALGAGFFVQEMQAQRHGYHLDDDPHLRSCNILFQAIPGNGRTTVSIPIRDPARVANFYGRDKQPRVRYVRELSRLDYGKANEAEYEFESLESSDA